MMSGRFSQLLQRIKQQVFIVENGLLVLLLTGMILLAMLQIVLRNGWDTGLSWADPTLRVAVLWVTLLGAMAATRAPPPMTPSQPPCWCSCTQRTTPGEFP